MEVGLSIKLVYPIIKTIALQGYDPEAFYAYTGFDQLLFQDPETRIAKDEYDRLLNAAVLFTGDEAFGIHMGRSTEISDLGVLGYVLAHSETLGKALEAYRRYNVILCSGINVEAVVDSDAVELRFFLSEPSLAPSRHCLEGVASSVYHMFMKLSCDSIPLLDVQFAYPPLSDSNLHKALWGRQPYFGSSRDLLRMPAEVLDYPIRYADAKLRMMFEEYVEGARKELVEGYTVSDRLTKWLTTNMPHYLPTLPKAAQELGMSIRSLQAKLQQENTTYNTLLTSARMDLAARLLQNPQHTTGEVAYLLHYSEPSAFHNAFKKFKGMSSGQFRAERLHIGRKLKI
jgi:AraC-like DNA-binding protein